MTCTVARSSSAAAAGGAGPSTSTRAAPPPSSEITIVRGFAPPSGSVVRSVRADSSSSAGGNAAMPCETRVRHRSTGSPCGPASGRTSDTATCSLLRACPLPSAARAGADSRPGSTGILPPTRDRREAGDPSTGGYRSAPHGRRGSGSGLALEPPDPCGWRGPSTCGQDGRMSERTPDTPERDRPVAGMVIRPSEEPRQADEELREAVTSPAKVMRIGSMVRQLLDEVRHAPLDEAGRARMREIYETSVRELSAVLSPDLAEELGRVTRPFEAGTPSEAELRVAQAQLVGWLEGLFHGIQATLFAQQMAARNQLEEMRRRAIPGRGPREDPTASGQYL